MGAVVGLCSERERGRERIDARKQYCREIHLVATSRFPYREFNNRVLVKPSISDR